MKRLATTLLGGLAALMLAGSVHANPVSILLGLSLDGSGSISSSNWSLQTGAYANLLKDPSILPQDGSVVIYVNQFSTGVTGYGAYRITSQADANNLAAIFTTMSQMGSTTNISGAITDAANALKAWAVANLAEMASSYKSLIDVSTDGAWNVGLNPKGVAAGLVSGGINQINCLGVGKGADCSWIPAGSFAMTSGNFAEFEAALKQKLYREIHGVPEPSVLALFGLGLGILAVVMVYRRRIEE